MLVSGTINSVKNTIAFLSSSAYDIYKYKDKNAMHAESVLELVGSPAVLCK